MTLKEYKIKMFCWEGGGDNARTERSQSDPQLHWGPTKVIPSTTSTTPSFFVIVRPQNVRRSVGECKTWEQNQILLTYPPFFSTWKSPRICIGLTGCQIGDGGGGLSCPVCPPWRRHWGLSRAVFKSTGDPRDHPVGDAPGQATTLPADLTKLVPE